VESLRAVFALASTMLVFVLALALVALILWVRFRQDYFKRHGVPYVESIPLLGAFTDVLLMKASMYEAIEELYRRPELRDKPFYGIFSCYKPALMITDPELIKRVLVKDFNSFSSHHAASGDHDPLGNLNLFAVKAPTWKMLRGKLSPFFSSGKMKLMFGIFDELSTNLARHIDSRLDDNGSVELEVKDFSGRYSTDVIARCAYGVDANSLKNPSGEFRSIGKHIFTFTTRRGFEFTAFMMFPELMRLFRLKFFSDIGDAFIRRTISHIMAERRLSGVRRHDLIDLLIEIEKSTSGVSTEMLIAQAALFFTAGHETSAITMTFALYEMAKNGDIQRRVKEEIRDIMMRHDGEVNYDGVMHEATYLRKVVTETLRLYPVLSLIDRECTAPEGYSLEPFSDFKIPHKMPIYIPMFPIQRDEKFFPDPLTFNPDRYETTTNPFANLPFGAGPRSCVGERFGLMQVNLGIVKILQSFRVELTTSTPRQIRYATKAIFLQPDEPLLLKFVKESLVVA
jgi:cytochrome P450 family 6